MLFSAVNHERNLSRFTSASGEFSHGAPIDRVARCGSSASASFMIQSSVTIVAGTGQRIELKRALRALVGPVRVEPGCLGCQLYEDVEQPDAFSLVEEWASAADIERRLRSDQYRMLLQLMESSPQPPKVVFHFVDRTQGLDRVQQARLQTRSSAPHFLTDFRPPNPA